MYKKHHQSPQNHERTLHAFKQEDYVNVSFAHARSQPKPLKPKIKKKRRKNEVRLQRKSTVGLFTDDGKDCMYRFSYETVE